MDIPDIAPYLGESAILGVLVSLLMGIIKTRIQSDIGRLAAAWALSAVVGVAWVAAYAFVIADEPFSIGKMLTSVPIVWASSVAVWQLYKPVVGTKRKP